MLMNLFERSLLQRSRRGVAVLIVSVVAFTAAHSLPAADTEAFDATKAAVEAIGRMKVRPGDWPQWGGSSYRNNTPEGKNIATTFDVATGENIKWWVRLGSESYGNQVVANGKVFMGTNNGAGYIERYPTGRDGVDLGVFVCFDAETGKFLWQHSSEKLPTGRVHDWPNQGICSAGYVDGDRVWFVSSRGEVICCDTEGFHDGENDGPYQDEKPKPKMVDGKEVAPPYDELKEADVVWKFDMMSQLGVEQHNMASCSITGAGDIIFVCTSNGVDESHTKIPQPLAPSFLAMNRNTGEVLWTDNSPRANILHGQWGSPSYGVLGGREQVIFGGGDGWLYSFDPRGENGKSKLLWKFDCNPKKSVYLLNKATRNHLIGSPVIYDGLIYIGVGEDPEHGEGAGHLWCIDPTKSGDVSPTIVYNKKDPETPIEHKRNQALVEADGDFEKPNPNSAAVWHYEGINPKDRNNTEMTMHRTCGSAAIKDGLLFIADFSGILHCVDAKTGSAYWTYDMLAASWASPLIVDGHVYIGDEDGDVAVLKASKTKELVAEVNLGNRTYTTPIVANNILYVASNDRLFAIQPGAQSSPKVPAAGPGSTGSSAGGE
jgi:outer membrane protein assembly factor BamB